MIRFHIGSTRCTLTFGFAAVVCAGFIFGDAGQTALLLGCVLWHEAGHILALFLLRAPPKTLRMTVFGLELAAGPRSTGQDALVSLAGPLANLLAAVLVFPFWSIAARLHLLLGLFHLLPILPLDGGQALHSLLCLRFSRHTAGRVGTAVSLLLLLPLGTLGFWLLLQKKPNLTLFLLCLYLLFYLVFKAKEE